jgi:ABC-2 type transport system ATP-binding protein
LTDTAIETNELSKVYDDGKTALDALSLTVPTGEIFGFLGRNGAGKTTTVRVLSTLTRLTGGEARICGLDVTTRRTEVRRRIGLSLQQAGLDDLMTAREHLTLIAELAKIPRARAGRRIEELLESFGLDAVADTVVAACSVGMRRRLDAAMALVHEPDVLFLDEPTTGLDPQSRRALWSLVRRFRENGGTVFLTTQYLDEADELCDRIAILDSGRIAVLDTPDGLKREVGGKFLRVRTRSGTAVGRVGEALGGLSVQRRGGELLADLTGAEDRVPELLAGLREAGVPAADLHLEDPTLEDVFVRLTGEGVESQAGGSTAAGVAAFGRTIATTRGAAR